jgi:putative hydrolase of the HAD superfamily
MAPADPLLDVVFFDVDDTLYSTTAFAQRAREAAIRAMITAGLRVGLEEGMAELGEVVSEFASNYASHFDRLLDRLGPERSAGRNRAVLVAAGVVGYHRTKEGGLEVLPDVRAVLEALSRAEVRLGVISAGLQVKQAEKLIRLDVLRYLDPAAIFFSDQVGVSKPNPKLYALACRRAGVAPGRALYVGDRPSHDCVPAARAGMRTVHYTGAGGKYGREPCDVEPDHEMADLRELLPLLRARYGLDAV